MNGMDDRQVRDIEIELTGRCNLRCPLCASTVFPDRTGRPNQRELSEWTTQLDRYSGLKSVCISGICSEPTLYSDIVGLLDYFVSRGVTIELYTNASTHDEEWWHGLGRHLTDKDLVVFTVCGSTDEIHGKYRVGQDLQTVLRNAMAFKMDNHNGNDCIQHISFRYNEDDFKKNMKPIISMFSKRMLIKTPPYCERFHCGFEGSGICTAGNDGKMYMALISDTLRRKRLGNFKIDCMSKKKRFLTLDQFGNEYPCFLYRLFSNDRFDKRDYSRIDGFEYDFCHDCETRMSAMMKMFGVEDMI